MRNQEAANQSHLDLDQRAREESLMRQWMFGPQNRGEHYLAAFGIQATPGRQDLPHMLHLVQPKSKSDPTP